MAWIRSSGSWLRPTRGGTATAAHIDTASAPPTLTSVRPPPHAPVSRTRRPLARRAGYQDEWSALIDPPALTPVLEAILGPDYLCASAASGGDFALPGALSYQPLHSDGWGPPDPQRDMPASQLGLCVIFPMEVVLDPEHTVGHSPYNGATRQIRGTQYSQEPIPSLETEPRWMRLATLGPSDAGDAVVRDNRSWHGCARSPTLTPLPPCEGDFRCRLMQRHPESGAARSRHPRRQVLRRQRRARAPRRPGPAARVL